ncbi:MAG TPA: GNAT family N-acetyltransferase [Thermoleophilaceae bacterium]
MQLSASTRIRSHLRPGDVGAVAALHGVEYAEGYGLDNRFEAYVARSVADFALVLSSDPDAGRVWLTEDAEGLTGCIAITHAGGSHGRLRWFLVARRARGQGLGKELLAEALAYARERFRTLELETFSELTAAAHMYRLAGFVLRDSAPQSEWGREVELQHYDLRLC